MHSDCGSQYCSAACQHVVRHNGLLSSINANVNCYDNACAESFFHSLKVEAVQGGRFAIFEEMPEAVLEYIEVDYSHYRRHSANGYISPTAFEAKQSLSAVSTVRGQDH